MIILHHRVEEYFDSSIQKRVRPIQIIRANPAHIIYYEPCGTGSRVCFIGNIRLDAAESPEQIDESIRLSGLGFMRSADV